MWPSPRPTWFPDRCECCKRILTAGMAVERQGRLMMKRFGWAPATTWLTLSALLLSLCAGMTFTRTTSAQTSEQSNSRSALDQYAINLTTQALQRKIDAVESFDVEIERVITSLSASATKAPLLISQSDSDRSAIAREIGRAHV